MLYVPSVNDAAPPPPAPTRRYQRLVTSEGQSTPTLKEPEPEERTHIPMPVTVGGSGVVEGGGGVGLLGIGPSVPQICNVAGFPPIARIAETTRKLPATIM